MDFLAILEEELQEVKTYIDPTKYTLTKRAFSMNPIWNFNDHIIYILNNIKQFNIKEQNFYLLYILYNFAELYSSFNSILA